MKTLEGIISDGQIRTSEPTDVYEEQAWSRLTAEQFLAGYDDADAVYDRLNVT